MFENIQFLFIEYLIQQIIYLFEFIIIWIYCYLN